ncbi:MAG: hypothetical protein QM426_11420 [Euryarchaeota archaeon]|nr:hypothetical protein [Euryarchaeota archaeon]
MKVPGSTFMLNTEETEIHIREEFSTLDWIMEGLLEYSGISY